MTTAETTPTTELEGILDAASKAARPLAEVRPARRAQMLRAVADALDAASDELVPMAQQESHLPQPRLTGELVRTTFQLRMFADVLDEGAFLGATIDTPRADWPTGARPDLRRTVLPIGPVVVFAASNFPFAFSVAGGDTASALAAGCPVALKAHPGHPKLSQRTGDIVSGALREAGAPDGSFAVIYGDEAGRSAVVDHRVRAGGFTGSARGGRTLFDLACSRPDPIPFYAEMGSVNPSFVTPAAAAERPQEIAEGYLGSAALGTGQFCVKPGLLFVPEQSAGDFEKSLVNAMADRNPTPMLNDRIETSFWDTLDRLTEHPAIRVLARGQRTADGSSPTLLRTSASELRQHRDELVEECFGPASVLVSYSDERELLDAARLFQGELTTTVHGNAAEPVTSPLFTELQERSGRLVWNGWPTGVSVTHAMQHGGPYPATTAATTTSVGTAAIERFLRPVCYQNAPTEVLPEAVRDGNPLGIPRRVDGVPEQAGRVP